jgi:hypothetical protein
MTCTVAKAVISATCQTLERSLGNVALTFGLRSMKRAQWFQALLGNGS